MVQRKLAAIMFSDIVDYTSLLKEDEKKAFDARKKNQRIHKRLIKKFNGRWLKDMESGTLASFSSIIDAVMCALSIQKATKEIEIPVRIGIHLGEVIFEKEDVLGDGVNIASRIQNVINTSGIVISEKVYSDIKNKAGLEIESLGSQTLKGVDSAVGIYKVSCHDYNLLDFTIDTGELVKPMSSRRTAIVVGIVVIALLAYALYYFIPKATPLSEIKKRVLLLPPENYLGTDTLDYVFAGMHDALIGDMGKIGALNVISRTSSVAFMKEGKSMSEIASEYNIDYIIESSVLCYSDSVCTQFKVFDDQENELSVQDFSVEKSQILNLYNTVVKEISNEIGIILTPEQERLLAKSRTVDKEAYDAYLRGFSYVKDLSHESLYKARDYLHNAIEKDPDWAPLHAAMAVVWESLGTMGAESPEITSPFVYEYLNKALELDPDLVEAHYLSAFMAWNIEWDWEKAEKEFLKALSINPNHALSRLHYSHLLYLLQRNEEGSAQANQGYKLDPLNPLIQTDYGWALLQGGDCASALTILENVLASDSDNYYANNVIRDAAFLCGDLNGVFEAEKRTLPLEEKVMSEIDKIYNERGFYEAYEEIIHHLEVLAEKTYISPADMTCRYYMINKDDKAMEWIEKGAKVRDPATLNMCGTFPLPQLYDNPRFIEVFKKMNLPLP